MGDKLSAFRGKEGIMLYSRSYFSRKILMSEGVNCYFLL